MTPERYVLVQALQTKDDELIPVWDERVTYSKSDMYGGEITLKDGYRNSSKLVECVLDIKTKELKTGIELDFYPDKMDFKKGQPVMVEASHRKLRPSTIVDIVFEEYELEIVKGKKIDQWWVKYFKDVEFINDRLYAIKKWKPYFILEDGTKVKWEYQLYSIV